MRPLLVACLSILISACSCEREKNNASTERSEAQRRASNSDGTQDPGHPPSEPSARLPSVSEREDDAEPDVEATTLEQQRTELFSRMKRKLLLAEEEVDKLRAIFGRSKMLGQGNPEVTTHPMSRAECRAARKRVADLPDDDARCGKPNMVALYDPGAGQTLEDARVCIDQYEFPNLPCEYPVVYARANEVLEICAAMGKRICDAHEWEGACAGALRAPEIEYPFGERRMMMEYLHNKGREITWAYGAVKDHGKCATGSRKSPKCSAGGWSLCGSNTYPAGAFPECRSRFGVFDLHGNAAEHMNLPLLPEQLASRGGSGETEMKGSWFIFGKAEAHLDDCRWRAPQWHRTRVADANSHANYHLGFRCCRDL
ncbi:MAG TPA: SUMF1/EgtB/PvdO family nonheme iron enzyme [Polyangiaceae bacterium]